MRRVSVLFAGIFLFVFLFGLTKWSAGASKAGVLVNELTVEYRSNPLGIDTTVPRFSWQIQSGIRAQKQTAYHILVASSPEKLAKDRGDLWDSGKVLSDRSVLVPYAGKALTSGVDCHWKVRVWLALSGVEGSRKGTESDWSRPARFSIGPLESADWKGEWIKYSKREKQRKAEGQWIWLDKGNPAREASAGSCYFRRVFTVDSNRKIKSAQVQMTADNQFELWVNGKRAGSGDNWRQSYNMDVTSLVQPGDNILAVKAVNTVAGPAGLIGTLRVTYEKGDNLNVSTDEKWLAVGTAKNDWQASAHSADGWRNVKVLGPKGMAPWSEAGGHASKDTHVWFRKTFTLADGVASALVYVASIGYHELYINGQKADDRVLAPAGSRLDKRVDYVTYDVTDKLRAGENVLAIWHGPGWARFYGSFNAEPALIVQADILTKQRVRQSVVSDTTWKCCESSSGTVGAGYGGEEIAARKQGADWHTVGFDDRNWDNAVSVKRDVQISAQIVEPDRVIEIIKPVKIADLGPSSPEGSDVAGNSKYKVDMGRNYTGWFEIRNLRGEAGSRITIHVADDPKSREDFGQIHSYICGETPGTFRNRFNYAGGRFVTLEGLSYKPSLADITGYAISSDFKRTGHFRCSSELLNRIYKTDLWTFRANTLNGVTMDCPHRERLGYGEVSWATAWGCGLPNYRAGAFYTQMVRNWCDVQHEDGWIAFVAPQMRGSWGGPLWSSAPLTVSWEAYRTYGDKRLLANAYPSCKKWMEFLNSKVSNGVLTQYDDGGRFLGDWAAPGGRKEWGGSQEALLFNNCVYALDLKMMIDIAAALDKKEDVAIYTKRLEELRTNIHQTFFHAEKNIYLAGRQMNLAFPLYVGVVPEDVKPAVLANLEKEITETRPYLDMGSSGLPVLMHYLIEDVERNDILYSHLSKTTLPSFGYFLEKDETTWPEYWEVNVPSKIHTCFTGVASWFIKGIGGIRNDPTQPGYKSFVIKPHLVGDLTFANTTTESLYGKIVSNWTRKDGEITLQIEVPVNSTATVYVPGRDRKKVKEGGKPAGQSEGVQFIRAEKGYLVFTVESGAYKFVSAR